ncbi:hypothetical protein AVEN_55722-1 [Araneus ventricosus]|uniref:Uncharacterized protein n=1 Tax=Araneus ventricosus TaxID=182803 RepID=A0A4Y2M3X1_ARAVE|nr:hypothetical protein AVEN_55722-1 [Araneus ventricosus]
MTLMRITTILCNNRQLLQLILKWEFEESYERRLCSRKRREWADIQAMANELVSQICSCDKLSDMIMEMLWPVCCRIMLWKSKYAYSIGNHFLRHFHWRSEGRIDDILTAIHITGNKNISIRRRFVLACSVGFYRDMMEIWKETSNDDKMYFRSENREKVGPLLRFCAHFMESSYDLLPLFLYDACACAF